MPEPRIAPITESEMTDEIRELIDKAGLRAPDGAPLHIFGTLVKHPKLYKRWMVFAGHVLSKSTLSPRHRELLILRTGYRCRSRYEWGQHVLIARACGIDDSEIAAVATGSGAGSWAPVEAALLRAADELHDESRISDPTWEQLAAAYSTEQLLDIVFTVGNYHLVAMALNTFGVELDDGVPDNLPD